MQVDYNKAKYYLEHSDLLSEAEKLQLAKDLLELERQGVIEWRDGAWQLAPGVEISDTPDGPVVHFPNKEEGSN